MKRFFIITLSTLMLVTAGCGEDAPKPDPNAPVANQPGANPGNGWTTEQIQVAAERCAAYGLYYTPGTRLNNWLNFCNCGYSAISQACTYDQFRQYSSWCIEKQYSAIQSCVQSAGLNGGATQALDAD